MSAGVIHWSRLDAPRTKRFQSWWRRHRCPHAGKDADGRCLGYSRKFGDDEPCDVCKACDSCMAREEVCDA